MKINYFYILKDKLSLDEILKYILFAIASKSMKYIRINLTNTLQDFKSENYIFAKRGRYLNREIFYVHGLENKVLLRHQYYSKQSSDLMQPL